MAKIVAQGQLTIVDMHDMPPVQGRLTSNLPKIVVLGSNGKDQNPSWSSTNLVVTAELYKAGNPNDLVSTGSSEITGITWYSTLGSDAETQTLPSGVTPGKVGTPLHNNKLTISSNLLSTSKPTLKLRAVIQYKYSGTNQSIPVSVEIDFGLANSGTAGQDSFSGMLTNTSHTFPATYEGAMAGSYSIETSALIYKGTSLVSGTSLAVKSGQTLPSGLTVSAVDGKTNSVLVKVAKDATLGGQDNGVIYLTASGEGKTFDLAFSWSKSRQGSAGDNATAYWSMCSAAAVVKKWNGSAWVYEPSSITVKGMSQTGEESAKAYSGRYKFQLYNGTTALTDSIASSTSSTDEASKTFNLPTGLTFTHVLVTMYKQGGTTTILDEQEIRVVQEPKKAVVVAVSADSDTIRNGVGTATISVRVYKDGTDVSATATKRWYKGVSGTSFSSATSITVSASDITTSEMYRCTVSVDGTDYSDSIVIYDVTDPIQMTVTSSNGEVFKNGVGSTDLTCRLWRNGSVLDEEGTKYAYCWHKIKEDGTEDTTWGPSLKTPATSGNKSLPIVAKLTAASSGSTLTLDNVSYIGKGSIIFLGSVATAYTVSAVSATSGTAGTVTLSVAPASTASGTAVNLASYKEISVTDSQVDEKATFICELIE